MVLEKYQLYEDDISKGDKTTITIQADDEIITLSGEIERVEYKQCNPEEVVSFKMHCIYHDNCKDLKVPATLTVRFSLVKSVPVADLFIKYSESTKLINGFVRRMT